MSHDAVQPTHLINHAADFLDGLAKNELCILQPFEIQILEKIPRAINHSNLINNQQNIIFI